MIQSLTKSYINLFIPFIHPFSIFHLLHILLLSKFQSSIHLSFIIVIHHNNLFIFFYIIHSFHLSTYTPCVQYNSHLFIIHLFFHPSTGFSFIHLSSGFSFSHPPIVFYSFAVHLFIFLSIHSFIHSSIFFHVFIHETLTVLSSIHLNIHSLTIHRSYICPCIHPPFQTVIHYLPIHFHVIILSFIQASIYHSLSFFLSSIYHPVIHSSINLDFQFLFHFCYFLYNSK